VYYPSAGENSQVGGDKTRAKRVSNNTVRCREDMTSRAVEEEREGLGDRCTLQHVNSFGTSGTLASGTLASGTLASGTLAPGTVRNRLTKSAPPCPSPWDLELAFTLCIHFKCRSLVCRILHQSTFVGCFALAREAWSARRTSEICPTGGYIHDETMKKVLTALSVSERI
jgi:hypothetical protein